MPTFEHDAIKFNYEEVGQGQPLLMCHGMTGDLNAPKELLGELPDVRLIFLEARAHGKTEPLGPVSKICFKQFAADLHSLCEHLQIDRATVGGISMGSGIATRFALDFPGRATGLILVRPAWCDTPSPDNLKWAPLLAQLFDQHGREKWRQAFDEHPDFQNLKQTDPTLFNAFQEEFDEPLAIERRERLVRIPGDCPIQNWQEVDQLTLPALVIGNDKDTAHPFSTAEAWAEHLPNGRLERVATKSIDLKQHNQDVRGLVLNFLEALA